MDHNDFDFYDDLTTPLFHFFMSTGISLEPTDNPRFQNGKIRMPKEAFQPPQVLLDKTILKKSGSVVNNKLDKS
jgi:hypothetical protein